MIFLRKDLFICIAYVWKDAGKVKLETPKHPWSSFASQAILLLLKIYDMPNLLVLLDVY
jgi:hypothetical protein